MLRVVNFFLPFILSLFFFTANGQLPKKTTADQITPKGFKPPKLTTLLGIRTDTATVFIEEARQLIRLPLKITDDKKNIYSISSYQFMYNRKAVTEDEETGKASPTKSMVNDLFRSTPLPDRWKNVITEQLKIGEELYFYDIIVKDATGHLMFAPTVKIIVK